MIALNLTIKRKWFDLIRTNVKKEEYRTFRNRQVVRLFNIASQRRQLPDNLIAVFRNGYHMGSAAVVVEIAGLTIRSGDEAQHTDWGEPTDKEVHMVIKLGKVLMIAPYYDVRKAFKKGGAE